MLEKIQKGDFGIGEVEEWEEYSLLGDDDEEEDYAGFIADYPDDTEV